MKYLVFITGASGVGKTTIVKLLEELMDKRRTAVFYFDDIGIPSIDEMIQLHTSSEKWQEHSVHQWIDIMLNIKEKNIVILEGSFYPKFAIEKLKALSIHNFLFICLDADRRIRERRLIEERGQEELANQDMENYAALLKEQTIAYSGVIVNTSHHSPSVLAHKLKDLISQSI